MSARRWWWMEWALRGAVLLGLALVAVRLRRRSGAGQRHLLLASSLALVLMLPFLGVLSKGLDNR